MRRFLVVMGVVVLVGILFASPATAQLKGAIFTTVADGSEVNFNIYGDKNDVYLDGGPGPGAPQGAAGLPDGTYVFMVTDPPGKTLLSTDNAACRRFTVAAGIITGVVPAGGCEHKTGNDIDHGATTVQLMPFNDTPNNGGEYKVWVTPVGNYLCSGNLNTVDCGAGKHGFVPRYSKTDNFKVRVSAVREIDTRFFDGNGNAIDGLTITWTDTNGASNNKHSYYNESLVVIHEAHVEAPENGTHYITIADQPGCTVGNVYLNGNLLPSTGGQTVAVKVLPSYKNITLRVDVNCN